MGHWIKREEITDLDFVPTPEEVDNLIGDSAIHHDDSWLLVHMPKFVYEYLCGNNPIDYKILAVEVV